MVAQPFVRHTYRFYNNLSTTEKDCGPDLIPAQGLNKLCQPAASTSGKFITDSLSFSNVSLSRTVYHNNADWGIKYLNPDGVIAKTYTVQLYLKVVNFNQYYTRIIDFSDGRQDNGIYFTNYELPTPSDKRCLNFYPDGNFGTCPFFNNYTYYLLTFTRNDTTKKIDIYVNDQLFTSYNDAADFYVSVKGKPVHIFRDDPVGFACEDGEANFAYLSFANYYSNRADVLAVYNNIATIVNTASFSIVPEPVCTGQNVTITYNGNIPDTAKNYLFNWTWDGGNIISGNDRGPFVVNWNKAGTKNIALQITSGECIQSSITNTQQIALDDFPNPVLRSNGILCTGDSIELSPGNFNSYLWQDGSTQSRFQVKKVAFILLG